MDANHNFIEHLAIDNKALKVRLGSTLPEWDDLLLHQYAYQENPESYALLALIRKIQPEQQARILFQILQSSRAGMSQESRQILERVSNFLLTILPTDKILTVFLAIRRLRANHKHTRKAILKYILNHPLLEDMASCRRPTVVDCVEHAMGKNVARACAKMLAGSSGDENYLHRHLFKFADNIEKVKEIFLLLYQYQTPKAGNGQYKLVHNQYKEKLEKEDLRPSTVTATNRGDISATLVHLYRGGLSTDLQEILDLYVEYEAAKLPKFKGKMALLLDVSASTRSYGEREFCTLSQSVALQMILQKCCEQLEVYQLGGSGYLPLPEGSTDLAMTLLDALEKQPDLVAIVSDGYENVYLGDLEAVVQTLPSIGVQTPIVFCHSKFTQADKLTWRIPAPSLPQLEFWHQEDFEDLLMSLFSRVEGDVSLQEFSREKLTRLESELKLWTTVK